MAERTLRKLLTQPRREEMGQSRAGVHSLDLGAATFPVSGWRDVRPGNKPVWQREAVSGGKSAT